MWVTHFHYQLMWSVDPYPLALPSPSPLTSDPRPYPQPASIYSPLARLTDLKYLHSGPNLARWPEFDTYGLVKAHLADSKVFH